MNLRAAATQTLARPTFREIAPFQSFDFATDGPLIGNPTLNRTLITNLDLRYEWFNAPGSIFAVSGYYKKLNDPIERAIINIENNVSQFVNVDEATIYGAEIELRQRLANLGVAFDQPVVRNLQVGGNLTLTRSLHDHDPDRRARRAPFRQPERLRDAVAPGSESVPRQRQRRLRDAWDLGRALLQRLRPAPLARRRAGRVRECIAAARFHCESGRARPVRGQARRQEHPRQPH